jgi:beta-1,4-N-acetylglucosaminyltransferase
MKICLVCSSGGHFFQLFRLKEVWNNGSHFWVSFPTNDVRSLLKDEHVYWASYPTNRNIKNFFKNLGLALEIFKIEQPDVIISTGAGVAVPFIIIGKLLKIKSIYIESITRIRQISLTGYLVYPFVDKFLVQWPELEVRYKKTEYHGQVV